MPKRGFAPARQADACKAGTRDKLAGFCPQSALLTPALQARTTS